MQNHNYARLKLFQITLPSSGTSHATVIAYSALGSAWPRSRLCSIMSIMTLFEFFLSHEDKKRSLMQINKQQCTRFYLSHFLHCHPPNCDTQMERTAPVPVLWNAASSKTPISTELVRRTVNKLKTLHNLLHLDDSLNLLPVSAWKRTRPWTADKKGQI